MHADVFIWTKLVFKLSTFSCKDTAIVNDSKRTTTCRAESDVELLVISKSVNSS